MVQRLRFKATKYLSKVFFLYNFSFDVLSANKAKKNKYFHSSLTDENGETKFSPSLHHSPHWGRKMVSRFWHTNSFLPLTDSGIFGLSLKIPNLCFLVCQVRLKRKILCLTRLLWIQHKVTHIKPLEKDLEQSNT